MSKVEYSRLLNSEEWKRKRHEILCRDGHKCRKCGSTTNLHVHHTYYISGHKPWEYRNSCLLTLCAGCHKKEHEGREISSFVVKVNKPKCKKGKKYKIEHNKWKKKKIKPKKTKKFKARKINEHLKQVNEWLRSKQNPNIKYNFSQV